MKGPIIIFLLSGLCTNIVSSQSLDFDFCTNPSDFNCDVATDCMSAECSVDMEHDFGDPFGTVDFGTCSVGFNFDNCRLPFTLTFDIECFDITYSYPFEFGGSTDACGDAVEEAVSVTETFELLDLSVGTVEMTFQLDQGVDELAYQLVGEIYFSLCSPDIPLLGSQCYDLEEPARIPLAFPR